MSEKYEGWNLYDKVTIVSKVMTQWNRETYKWETIEGVQQGYLVDPKNKVQLKTAQQWAETHRYDGHGKIIETISGTTETFENDGFELELLDSANGSTQGGKLSFWNCKISKNGKTWVIGINADLLLRALVSCTWVNGKCQEPIVLARCKGGVGAIPKSSPEYTQAQKDMATKANMSKGKTTKYKLGHCYETVTEASVYFGKIYQWYEPIYDHPEWGRSYHNRVIGFKLLKEPIEKELLFNRDEKLSNASDYIKKSWGYQFKNKCPSRKEGVYTINWDIADTDLEQFLFKSAYHMSNNYKRIIESDFGYSVHKDKPLIYNEKQMAILKECGLKFIKE